MGAASAILFEAENPGLASCVVVDSAFTNLSEMLYGIGKQFFIPKLVT
eukprot:CAMPEP_0170500622 /NCGR_PEP_ID=MMETSP0208-20121228/35462_1 /TAXON_ID=197538 /ORGANISM="Strombidium inclinatum, Strain S3" /LENGTH=47 /DNA_ID= /DNA_START= /DNA_END= /DNA_ORIENTATION=